MKQREFILCAAIWVNDGQPHEQQPEGIDKGFVVCGRRHHNCYQTLTDLKGDANEYLESINLREWSTRDNEGFMTSTDRYVNRRDAWKIAKENGQIAVGLACSDNGEDSILISENLYSDETEDLANFLEGLKCAKCANLSGGTNDYPSSDSVMFCKKFNWTFSPEPDQDSNWNDCKDFDEIED